MENKANHSAGGARADFDRENTFLKQLQQSNLINWMTFHKILVSGIKNIQTDPVVMMMPNPGKRI